MMIETLSAWLFAHVIGDFLLQTREMAENKRKPLVLLAHIAIITIATYLASGGHLPSAMLIGFTHLVIDLITSRALKPSWQSFLLDQILHLVVIMIALLLWPEAWRYGWWGGAPAALSGFMMITTAFLAITLAGGILIDRYMATLDLPDEDTDHGLRDAGRKIGYFERSLILLMVLTGQVAGIGLLIAAKSIMRFDTVSQNRAVSEYVIIGTLASFSIGLGIAYLAQFGLDQLIMNA